MTITELMRAIEIKTAMLFNLDFANSTILSRFFFFFLIIDLYFLILGAISQVLNPYAQFVILIEMSIKKVKPEVEIHPVIIEAEIRNCSI